MTSRRSFFKSLSLLGAAASAPGLFLPKFEPVRWKVVPVRQGLVIPNPEWINAKFEYVFIWDPIVVGQVQRMEIRNLHDLPPEDVTRDWLTYQGYPVRGNKILAGQIQPISPFVEI